MISQYKYFLYSSNPDALVPFYTDVLGFTIIRKLEFEKDYGYTLEICPKGMQIWIAKHSNVYGRNNDPFRHMLNLYTDSIETYVKKARTFPGVKIIADPFFMGTIIPDESRWCATLLDPEGNCLQLMGSK